MNLTHFGIKTREHSKERYFISDAWYEHVLLLGTVFHPTARNHTLLQPFRVTESSAACADIPICF